MKELAGAFNVYENPDTGQYLNAVTVREDAGKNKADLIRLTGDVELVRRDSEVVVLTGSHAYVCESLADWEPRFQQVTNV